MVAVSPAPGLCGAGEDLPRSSESGAPVFAVCRGKVAVVLQFLSGETCQA